MKNKLFFILLLITTINTATPQVTDPNHTSEGGYGYLIEDNDTISIWWAEGIYKVMRDTPTPKDANSIINIYSAKNESESFILVFNIHKTSLDNARVKVSALTNKYGVTINSSDIEIRTVEYVNVTHPTDSYGFKGMWPDPIPLHESSTTLTQGQNTSFWITVKVPSNTTAGVYKGTITIVANQLFERQIPLEVTVWDIELPKTPSLRSAFGMDIETVSKYENLNTKQDKEDVFEYYMQSFRDYKLSPYDPFVFADVKTTIKGINWSNGFYDSSVQRNGRYSYKVVDDSATQNIEAVSRTLIPITKGGKYTMSLDAKAKDNDQNFVVGVECYDAIGDLLLYENRFEIFQSDTTWNRFKLPLGHLDDGIKYIKVYLCPSNRTVSGENKGTMWFDDITIINKDNVNILPSGDFEVDIDSIDIVLNFDEFGIAARRYFDDYGFNSFRFILKGLGGGTYYSRTSGVFEGFEQGTIEYAKLMEKYLSRIENEFKELGILGKEYIYWFDEPGDNDYPFVYETNRMIKEYAPNISTFLTEHITGKDISDVTDISCTIWHKLDHDKIRKMNEKGLEHWSYLCVWPKSPWISEFIDHDAINMRLWSWASYKHGLKGILMWETTNWSSDAAAPKGKLLNPWDNAMAWVKSYGQPLGKQTIWGNGDGRFFYPNNRDVGVDTKTYVQRPVPSMRLEFTRDGIEDYELLVILEQAIKDAPRSKRSIVSKAKKLLEIPKTMYVDEQTYNKNPKELLERRKDIAEMILMLK